MRTFFNYNFFYLRLSEFICILLALKCFNDRIIYNYNNFFHQFYVLYEISEINYRFKFHIYRSFWHAIYRPIFQSPGNTAAQAVAASAFGVWVGGRECERHGFLCAVNPGGSAPIDCAVARRARSYDRETSPTYPSPPSRSTGGYRRRSTTRETC